MFIDVQGETSKWMALVTVALGYFAVQLAMTSVPPMLPTLAQLFDADMSQASWAMTAYFLTVTSCMLMSGRLGDAVGYAQVFAWGMVVYTLATLACGLAQSMTQVIVLRGMQGIGGALTAQTDPALYIRGFQAACMMVGCIALIAVACAFIPERATKRATKEMAQVGLAAQRR